MRLHVPLPEEDECTECPYDKHTERTCGGGFKRVFGTFEGRSEDVGEEIDREAWDWVRPQACRRKNK